MQLWRHTQQHSSHKQTNTHTHTHTTTHPSVFRDGVKSGRAAAERPSPPKGLFNCRLERQTSCVLSRRSSVAAHSREELVPTELIEHTQDARRNAATNSYSIQIVSGAHPRTACAWSTALHQATPRSWARPAICSHPFIAPQPHANDGMLVSHLNGAR